MGTALVDPSLFKRFVERSNNAKEQNLSQLICLFRTFFYIKMYMYCPFLIFLKGISSQDLLHGLILNKRIMYNSLIVHFGIFCSSLFAFYINVHYFQKVNIVSRYRALYNIFGKNCTICVHGYWKRHPKQRNISCLEARSLPMSKLI